ncbi:MAG TPA: DegT/DnrJ/EryC1/StrS family aminotransferase [Myxococcota bacterium]|nr:DegT/DnrJ/EryC1/StrS family aminotransferase [Myxococcota bacterium]
MPPIVEDPAGGEIPLLDLRSQHRQIQAEILAAIGPLIERQRFINGPEVAQFESGVADYLGVEHAIGVSSGTDALLAVLMALGVGPDDEVITTPFSFIATAEVILRLGARPVFADVSGESCLIRPSAVRKLLTNRTRAIIPVHLYGKVCQMDEFLDLSAERGIPIIEDCAQAMGARQNGRAAGSFGLAGAFSFFPSKNLGGWGDGGMLTTNDAALAHKLRSIREHGADDDMRYSLLGGNFRLDTIQAAVLSVKLGHLDQWLQARKTAAQYYIQLMVEAGLSAGQNETRHPGHQLLPPPVWDEPDHAFNLFVVRAERRDALKTHLDSAGIGCAVYYPTPLHLQPCFAKLGYRPGDFPAAEEAARSVLALPLYPEIGRAQQKRVVEAIAGFYHARA